MQDMAIATIHLPMVALLTALHLAMTGAIVVFSRQFRRYQGATEWAVGNAVTAVGYLGWLVGLLFEVPGGIPLGNLLCIAGMALLLAGTRRFTGRPGGRWRWLVLVAGMAVVLLVLSLPPPQLPARIAVTSLVLAGLALAAAATLLMPVLDLGRAGRLLTASVFGLLALGLLVRAALVLWAPPDPARLVESPAQVLMTAIWPAGGLLGTLCFLLLLLQRLRDDLEGAYRALRRENQVNQSLLDHIPAPVFLKDRMGRYLKVNRAWSEPLGLVPEQVAGKTDFDLLPPDLAGERFASDEQVCEVGELRERQEILPGPDGPMTVIVRKAPIRDAAGHPEAVCGVVTNITELKRAETALRASEERSRQMVETAFEGIWRADAAGALDSVSPRMAGMLGWTEAEMLGRRFEEFLHPEVAGDSPPDPGATSQAQVVLRHRDGRPVHVQLATSPLRDAEGRPSGRLGMVTDITARVEAERAALAASRQLESVASQITGGLLFQTELRPGVAPRLTWVSDGVEPLLGVSQAEVLRDFGSLLRYADPADLAALDPLREASIRTLEPYESVVRFDLPARGRRWIHTRVTPHRHDDGTVTGEGIATDVTALEQARLELADREAMLRQLGDNLPSGAIYRSEFDAQGVGGLTYVSAGFERLMGFGLEAVRRRPGLFLEQIVPEDQARYLEARTRAIETGTPSDLEVRVRDRQGQVRWLYLRSALQRQPDGRTVFDGLILDITAAKSVEQAARQHESHFRGAFYGAATGFAIAGPDRRFRQVNDVLCRMLGYTEAELLQKTFLDITHPDDHALNLAEVQHLWEGDGASRVHEKRYLHKDGHPIWVQVSLSRVAGAEGEPGYILGQIQDISRQKQMATELRDSEALLRAILDNLPVPVFLKDRQGRYLQANPAFLQRRGLTLDQVIGQTDAEVMPEIAGTVQAYDREAWEASGPLEREQTVPSVDGSRTVIIRKAPLRDEQGQTYAILGVANDITAHKQSETRLRHALNRLELANSAAGIGIWTWDFADDHLEWDERLADWYGLPPEIPRTAIPYSFWRSRVHPDDVAEAEAKIQEAHHSGQPFETEFRLMCSTGKVRHILSMSVVEHDAQGRAVGMIGINRDITAQRELEQSLRRATEAAEAASIAKSQFLANMSHEVRTPAAAVVGYANMLLDPNLPPEKGQRAIEAIHRNGSHLLSVLNDILDLSKVESGQLELMPVPYAPSQLMREVDAMLRGTAEDRGIGLAIQPDGDLPATVLIDPTAVRQVLVNLLGNAIKFSEAGQQVRLRVGARPPTAAVPGALRLVVEDQGIGISPDEIQRMFLPFHQADNTPSRRYGGTGLGLSIAHRLVEAMHGTIAVDSALGRGSRFTVELPLSLPTGPQAPAWLAPAQVAVATTPEPAGVGPRTLAGRLLLVEDNEDNRRVLLYQLRRLDLHDVAVAVDGRDGVDAARRLRPDVILMDMQMPELDGYEATRELRSTGYRAPIVALTAHSMSGDRAKCLGAGCDEYLTKPVDVDRLALILKQFLPDPAAPLPVHPRPTPVPTPAPDPDRAEAAAPGRPGLGLGLAPVPAAVPPPRVAEPIVSEASDDPDLMELVRLYVEGLPAQVRALEAATAAGDLDEVGRVVHKLKGTGGMYGYPILTASATRILEAVRAGQSIPQIEPMVADFAGLVPRIARGLDLVH